MCSGLLKNVWPLFETKQLVSKVRLRAFAASRIWSLVFCLTQLSQVHSVFPARECVRAHELMDSGDFTGKIVLSWAE